MDSEQRGRAPREGRRLRLQGQPWEMILVQLWERLQGQLWEGGGGEVGGMGSLLARCTDLLETSFDQPNFLLLSLNLPKTLNLV